MDNQNNPSNNSQQPSQGVASPITQGTIPPSQPLQPTSVASPIAPQPQMTQLPPQPMSVPSQQPQVIRIPPQQEDVHYEEITLEEGPSKALIILSGLFVSLLIVVIILGIVIVFQQQ